MFWLVAILLFQQFTIVMSGVIVNFSRFPFLFSSPRPTSFISTVTTTETPISSTEEILFPTATDDQSLFSLISREWMKNYFPIISMISSFVFFLTYSFRVMKLVYKIFKICKRRIPIQNNQTGSHVVELENLLPQESAGASVETLHVVTEASGSVLAGGTPIRKIGQKNTHEKEA